MLQSAARDIPNCHVVDEAVSSAGIVVTVTASTAAVGQTSGSTRAVTAGRILPKITKQQTFVFKTERKK
jgi:hypothetical protein